MEFQELFMKEITDTMEGLTGVRPNLEEIKTIKKIPFEGVKINATFNEEEISFFMSRASALSLGDMMLGGDGSLIKSEMSADDIDASYEIFENTLGAMNTELANNSIESKFIKNGISFISEENIYKKNLLTFDIFYGEKVDKIYVLCNKNLLNKIEKKEEIKEMEKEESLIDDILVKVTILIGSKELTLEELKSLHENNVIELEQLANDPLKVFVNNVPYGEGEVVIVDGMYGVQITKLYKKEDVYHV